MYLRGHFNVQVNEISTSFEVISRNENVYFDLGEAYPVYRPSNVKVTVWPLRRDGQVNVRSSEGSKVLWVWSLVRCNPLLFHMVCNFMWTPSQTFGLDSGLQGPEDWTFVRSRTITPKLLDCGLRRRLL